MAYLHTIKTIATSAVTAALVAALAAPAAPGPVPPPPGSTDPMLAQRVATLEVEAADTHNGVWEWRAFQRCTHQRHITYPTRVNAAVPVTWKRDCPYLEVPR